MKSGKTINRLLCGRRQFVIQKNYLSHYKQVEKFIDILSAICQCTNILKYTGISKFGLTENIEKRIITTRGGISHINTCVGGVDNGSNERLCCSSG